jgi:hypothetical protein
LNCMCTFKFRLFIFQLIDINFSAIAFEGHHTSHNQKKWKILRGKEGTDWENRKKWSEWEK